MSNLITIAAGLMDGGDELTVVRDPEDNSVIDVRWSHNDEPAEYLRGMVELIAEHTGFPLSEGLGRTAIYEAILSRVDVLVRDI